MGAALHHEIPQSVFCKTRALVMLGLPGAGKGTQARAVSGEFGVPSISTGAMLRDAVDQKTQVGRSASTIMESGQLVPDPLVCGLVEERTANPDCERGFVLDGFPRNVHQGLFLDRLLEARGWGTVLALFIQVNSEALFKRLAGRQECSTCGTIFNIYLNPPRRAGVCDKDGSRLIQRKDDSEETVRRRFNEFESQTRPLIERYRSRGLLREVDGNGEPRSVTQQIFRFLREP